MKGEPIRTDLRYMSRGKLMFPYHFLPGIKCGHCGLCIYGSGDVFAASGHSSGQSALQVSFLSCG